MLGEVVGEASSRLVAEEEAYCIARLESSTSIVSIQMKSKYYSLGKLWPISAMNPPSRPSLAVGELLIYEVTRYTCGLVLT